MAYSLMIAQQTGGKIFYPIVPEPVEWTTERRGVPGKLTFDVVKDDMISYQEGDAVKLMVNGKPIFFGFVFTKKGDRDQIITTTAYDQLRYFQNKDTYIYEEKTATQVLQMIAADFGLKVGECEDTGYVIESRVEDNTSLFDIVGNALDLTLTNTKNMFVLYDDAGKLTLKSLANMRVGSSGSYFMIDAETAENFDYSSSIDSDTYNKIKLSFENSESGKREIYIAQDGSHMNQWGTLQYYDTLSKGENGQAKADALLKLYNAHTRNLRIVNALGDPRVRAGSMIVVNLGLGDISVQNFMLVEKATHKFYLDHHFMDLTLRGGEFVG